VSDNWVQLENGHWSLDLSDQGSFGAGALTDGSGFWCDGSVGFMDYGPYPTLEAAKQAAVDRSNLAATNILIDGLLAGFHERGAVLDQQVARITELEALAQTRLRHLEAAVCRYGATAARVAELEAALRMCMLEHHKSAAQFRFYEVSHLSKAPPDTEKAKTNADHQIRCLAARDAAAKALG
jgi:hypothetical protein